MSNTLSVKVTDHRNRRKKYIVLNSQNFKNRNLDNLDNTC
jgi:hypothetical protein